MRQRDENLTIRATDLPYERPAAHQAQAGSGGKDKEQDALGRHPRGWNIWLKGAFLTVITHTHTNAIGFRLSTEFAWAETDKNNATMLLSNIL